MANGLDILNAAKKQKAEAKSGNAQSYRPKSPIKENKNIISSGSIEDLERLYFSDADTSLDESLNYEILPNGDKRKIYDPKEEMKELQNGSQFNNKNSKMPSAILESIMRNPLDMPTEGLIQEDVIDENVQNKAMDIINKLESRDGKHPISKPKAEINESEGFYSQTSSSDIAQLIESILDKKLKQYAGAIINESRKIGGTNSPTMKFMKLGDTFTFMDDANNVYECKMVYKGKGKVKNQK